MAQLEQISLPPIQNGILRNAAVDSGVAPPTTANFALNLHFDSVGAATLRKGIALVGSQITASTPVLGMTNYRNNAGTDYEALAKVGTAVYSYAGSSWSSVRTGLTANSKARFTSFVDYIFMVNGTGNEVLNTYAGTGSFGTTNAASLPKGDVIENYRSRIWVGQSTIDKLYYSDVVTTSNTITGGTAFLQISPADGEKITALKRHPRALLVFKQNHIYRVFSINATDPDPSIFRGTYSQESVLEGKNGISYHHPTGFYDFVFDGQQREISRPIIDIVQAIPRSYYENVSGWVDDDHKYWSVGDITLDGVSFTNIVCRYTISTEIWTIYSYSSEPRSSTLYDNGTTLVTLIGNDNGQVMQLDSGTTDNSSPIFYDLQSQWYTFTGLKTTAKTLNAITALHEKANGGNLSYQLNTDTANIWHPIGQLNRDLYQIFTNINAKDFYRIRFRFHGSSIGTPFVFRGWETLSLMTEGQLVAIK